MDLIKNGDFTYFKSTCKQNDAKIIVFIHGFATTSEYHDTFYEKIKDKYDYYAIQLPGHGIAALIDKNQLSPMNFANHIASWIKSMKFNKKIYLIGHSMGGGISLLVSTLIPELIEKLTIVTPMNDSFSFKHLNILKFIPKNNVETYNMQKIILHNPSKFYPLFEMDPKIEKETNYQLENRDAFKYLRNKMMSISNMLNLKEARKNNKLPTLLILGKYDNIIYWKSAKKVFSKFNNYNIQIFENSAHLPFWEELDKYTNSICDFIEA